MAEKSTDGWLMNREKRAAVSGLGNLTFFLSFVLGSRSGKDSQTAVVQFVEEKVSCVIGTKLVIRAADFRILQSMFPICHFRQGQIWRGNGTRNMLPSKRR
jgi:hypothetical protein